LYINSLIKTNQEQETEAWQAFRDVGSNMYERYILDHETESMASDHCDTLLWAIDSLIRENEPKLENAKLEFEKVHKGGFLDEQEELDKYLSLETRHSNLTETRRYVLDLALLDGSSARVQQND
jgi:hypothetical protein